MSGTVPWNSGGGEIKWGEDNPIENVPELGEEEKLAIKQRMEALDKLLASQGMAKYKIELMFGKRRSMRTPVPGALTFWESSQKFHGGGDTKMYICPGKDKRVNNCSAFIPMSGNGYGFLLCPGCATVWQGDDVHGEVMLNLPLRKWSEVILTYFAKLEHNADLYIKYHRTDIRAAALMEQQREMRGDKINLAREDRPKLLYPLKNIIKDSSAGADLLGRFYACLTA